MYASLSKDFKYDDLPERRLSEPISYPFFQEWEYQDKNSQRNNQRLTFNILTARSSFHGGETISLALLLIIEMEGSLNGTVRFKEIFVDIPWNAYRVLRSERAVAEAHVLGIGNETRLVLMNNEWEEDLCPRDRNSESTSPTFSTGVDFR